MYAVNKQAAIEADNFSSYLNETGKYKGQFVRAECLVSRQKGTHGIGFTFEDESKRSTRFDIWTMKKDGEQLSGYKTLSAILTVLGIKEEIEPKPGEVERYDHDTKKMTTVQAEVFPQLIKKAVGLVLRSTEYAKVNRDGVETGETGWRLELVAPFRAADEFTASEIWNRATAPERLAGIIATLQDKPLKNKPLAAANRGRSESPASGAPDNWDDSIPF